MNTLADGWEISQKHLAGQHDQGAHGRRGGVSFDDSPATQKIRGEYGRVPYAEWSKKWENHVRSYVNDSLNKSGLTVYRSAGQTGISNEGYGSGFFTSLSRAHASGYAKGGAISEFRIPKGSRLYDESAGGRVTDIGKLISLGYSGILRPSMNEVILFPGRESSF